jgi:hypothetical protein
MRKLPPDVLVEVLGLVKKKTPAGVAISEDDIRWASEIVYTQHVIDTLEWKMNNITIKGESK